MKDLIKFEDFAKTDMRIGLVKDCVKKDGSDRLLRLTVDFGPDGVKNILSGIAPWYQPDELIGQLYVFIINLEPRMIMNEESQGMILATDSEKPYLISPLETCPPGTTLR